MRRFRICNRFFAISSSDAGPAALKFGTCRVGCEFVAKSMRCDSENIRIEFYVANNVERDVHMLFSLISHEVEKSTYVEVSVGRRLDVDQFCSTQHHLCVQTNYLSYYIKKCEKSICY